MNQTSPSLNPYVGPRTFTEQEGRFFFGREREARDLTARIVSERLLLFYAPSGAGKSSLLNTRVIPKLRDEEHFQVLPVGRVSGELPAGLKEVKDIYAFNLMASLDHAESQRNAERDAQNRRGAEPARLVGVTLSDFLARLARETSVDAEGRRVQHWVYKPELTVQPPDVTAAPQATGPRFVLVIDQFEELITGHPDRWPEREDFFRQLNQTLLDDPSLWVVLSLREDYLASLDPYAELLFNRLRARFYMERMGVDAALDAIRNPAELAGRPFAEGVAERLRDDLRQVRVPGQETTVAGQYVEPVQLQVACYQLWENIKQRPPGLITTTDLKEAGDVDRALTQFYEQTLVEALTDPAAAGISERQLRTWFDEKLITEEGTRGLVHQGETDAGGLPNGVVKALQRRFLVRGEARGGNTWIELVHDRFVEPIRRSNRAWSSRNLTPLTQAAQAWLEAGKPESKLYTGSQLAAAVAQLRASATEFGETERSFVQEGVKTELARATKVYKNLPDDAHRATMHRILFRMIAPEGASSPRRRVPATELIYPSDAENARVAVVLDRLVDSGLVACVTAQEKGQAGSYFEPLLDAFVQDWDLLLAWKREAEVELPIQRSLTQTAAEWDNASDDIKQGLLWSDNPRLPQLESMLGQDDPRRGRLDRWVTWARRQLFPQTQISNTLWLNQLELKFVRASLQKRSRYMRWMLGMLSGVLIVLTSLLLLALAQRHDAIAQRDAFKKAAATAFAAEAEARDALGTAVITQGRESIARNQAEANATAAVAAQLMAEAASTESVAALADARAANTAQIKAVNDLAVALQTSLAAQTTATQPPTSTATARPRTTPTGTPTPPAIFPGQPTPVPSTPTGTPTRTRTPPTATPNQIVIAQQTQLAGVRLTQTAMAPLSGRIVFISTRDGPIGDLYITRVDGKDIRRLTTMSVYELSYTEANGGQLVVSSRPEARVSIYRIPISGEPATNLTGYASDNWEPAFSKNGQRIAFVSSREPFDWEIYVMNSDGTGINRLTNDDPARNTMPAWSPDGSQIAFVTIEGCGKESCPSEIRVMASDGSNIKPLVHLEGKIATHPAWSPDGGRIAFASNRDGSMDIFVVNANGTNLRNLSKSAYDENHPAWSPDGLWIAFTRYTDNTEIFMMAGDGTRVTQVTKNPASDWYPVWAR